MDVNSRDPLQNIIPFRIKGVEISRFDSSGNLKIGTTTTTAPTVRLDISGGAARVNSGSATSTALTTTGRIGVNTAAPTADLDVSGAARMSALSATATALTTVGRIGVNTATPTVDLDVSGASRMAALSATATALTTVGRIGVNMASPTVPLDVSGASRMSALSATATALTTTGRIGVNTAAPTVDLDVSGAARMSALSATATALTTVGRIGVNQPSPTVPLDVVGMAKISGELNMNSNKISNLSPPSAAQDAANKSYVDAAEVRATAAGVSNPAFQNGTATSSARYLYPSSGNDVGILTNNKYRLYVSPAGNVAIGENHHSPTTTLDVLGAANVSNYLTVGSISGTTTSILPNGFYVRTGGSNWRDYIPLLVADSTTNIQTWGGPDLQWYDVTTGPGNEVAKQYSYFAAYWLNANRAVVGTSFSVESYADNYSNPPIPTSRGTFTFTATVVTNGVVTAYEGRLSAYSSNFYSLTPQQDGIDAGVANRSLTNQTLLRGGSVETGYLGVNGRAQVNSGNATSTALTITGRVGIGTSRPVVPLDVRGFVFGRPNNNGPTIMGVNTINLTAGTIDQNCSISADHFIRALNFAAYSDKRIKKNIRPLQPNKCVEMIRDLSPVSYNYIDYITNSTCSMYGFIAQDVKKHIPDAISYKTDYVPNLYSQVKLSKYPDYNRHSSLWKVSLITSYTESGIFTFYPNKDNSGNEYVNTDGSPLSDSLGNQRFKIKFITYDSSGGTNEVICYTHKIINDREFIIDETSINFEEKECFLYGQEVPDFHILTYDYLWSVFASSLKEVDRQQQADKARIAELEATVASQQSLITDILERLNKNGL